MAIRQLKDGRWIVYYRDPKNPKKQIREYCGRGTKGKARAEKRNRQLAEERRLRPTGPSFEKLSQEYLNEKQGLCAESTLQNLSWKLTGVILPLLGNLPAEKITHTQLDRYVSNRLANGVKKTTIHRELSDISAIMSHAYRTGSISYNPAAGYAKPKRDDEIIRPPDLAEARAIMAAAPDHLRRALEVSYYCGLRPGRQELFSLQWAAVSWKNQTILVQSARKGGPMARTVPLHPQFYSHLRSWWSQDKPLGIVYIIHYKGRPINSLKGSWATAKKKAGIARRLRPYDMRHAFATGLLSAGTDARTVADLIGHSRPDTTLNIYAHADTALSRAAIAKLAPLTTEPEPTKKTGHTVIQKAKKLS